MKASREPVARKSFLLLITGWITSSVENYIDTYIDAIDSNSGEKYASEYEMAAYMLLFYAG